MPQVPQPQLPLFLPVQTTKLRYLLNTHANKAGAERVEAQKFYRSCAAPGVSSLRGDALSDVPSSLPGISQADAGMLF